MTTPLKFVPVGGNSGELREWGSGDVLTIGQGGTGVAAATLAQLRAGLGLGPAAVAAILGTVSQSGGVPTGAIFQTGSNANGDFFQFASGWQICIKTQTVNTAISNTDGGGVVYSTAVNLGSYPAAFSPLAPSVILTVSGSAGSFMTASTVSQTPTIWGSYFISSGAARAATNHYISCLAIGRWF